MSGSKTNTSVRQFDAWFRAFREQSLAPAALGDGEGWAKALGGGRSGATAALFLTTNETAETGGAAESIVLKWDELSKVLAEAEARRGRIDQSGNVDYLRTRGASHIAVRMHPRRRKLFGIIAYKYEGARSPRDVNNVTDFEKLLQVWNATGGGVGDRTLRIVFENTVEYFRPKDSSADAATAPSVATRALPDLKRDEYIKKAKPFLRKAGLDPEVLGLVETWWLAVVEKQMTPAFPDSRLVHGDPRFANILVDLASNKVTLIDFGAGDSGRHIFHDLARFEVDLVCRTTAPTADRGEEVDHRMGLILREGSVETSEPADPRFRPVEIWRGVRNEIFPGISLIPGSGVRQLYALFLVNELLRRIKWHSEGNDDSEVGATAAELIGAIRIVLRAVPA